MNRNSFTALNPNPLADDLEFILSKIPGQGECFRNKRIFITGGTGFFGCWLLESLAWATDRLDLNISIVVLSRNPSAFAGKAPHLANHPAIRFHTGDVTDFKFPDGTFDYIVHAATEASAKMIQEDPVGMVKTIVFGTDRVLEFARCAGVQRLLFISSGAVYGKQPHDVERIMESFPGAPDCTNPINAYGEAKRLAELLCASTYRQYNLECLIARCFAFIGPYLPLDIHYAAGNFIRDGLIGGPVCINGDGTPYRSYMYASDLVIWLWTILLRGLPCRPYNVGSSEAVSILELADLVAECFDYGPDVCVSKEKTPGENPERYIPDNARARKELSLDTTVNLKSAIRRTIAYYKGRYRYEQPGKTDVECN